MQNIYSSSGTGVCGKMDDDDDADDYENVIDNRMEPPIPKRSKAGNKVTGKREDLQLKCMVKSAISVDKAENRGHGPKMDTLFQPPPLGLDFASPAVNAAFRDQTVEQTSEKKHGIWRYKNLSLISYLVFMFLFWILLASLIFVYYANISSQLDELKKNASQVQDSTKKEIGTWKEDLMKVNQTLVNEITALKSDVQSIKRSLGLCTSCPAGWTLLASSCYFFSSSHQTWENSQKECSKMTSSLLILSSRKELDGLRPLIGNKRFWIGLSRVNRYTWRWVDGTVPVFTNWNLGEPNNSAEREHCTEMITGGWNDLDCSKTIDYICKKPSTC